MRFEQSLCEARRYASQKTSLLHAHVFLFLWVHEYEIFSHTHTHTHTHAYENKHALECMRAKADNLMEQRQKTCDF